MKPNNSESQLNTSFSYKYLLVKNVISFYEKSEYQEAKKDLKKCFMLDSQNNNKESLVVYNLCLILIFYKKQEIKKMFLSVEEINNKIRKGEVSLSKLASMIQEEEHLTMLFKKLLLKEIVLKKNNFINGIKLDDILKAKTSIWLKDVQHFLIFVNLFTGLIILQRNPTINSTYKNHYIIWLDYFKEVICSCSCGKFLI